MKPITSAATFMMDNLTDPVARLGTRPNGNVFYRTRGGILYEFDEAQIAVLNRFQFTVRLTPELAGTSPPAAQTDILSELKRVSRCVFKDGWESADLHARAGIEIAMLRARIAELQAAAPNVTGAIADRRDLSHVDLQFLVSAVDDFIAAKSVTDGNLVDAFRRLCGARFALSVPSITGGEPYALAVPSIKDRAVAP